MKVVAIIPSRYASTRLNGKPLADIAGKPMIQRVYEGAKAAGAIDDVIVATDDERIAGVVEAFGGKAVFTAKNHTSGTDRVAEVAAVLNADIIVNLQGDEPFIEPKMIDDVIYPLSNGTVMSTLKKEINDISELENPNVVKVVTDKDGFALYFSRYPIPYMKDVSFKQFRYKHIGLYAYKRPFLLALAKMEPTPLELSEKLEQLRTLENGFRIKVVETEYDTISVDTPDDLARARERVHELGITN